MRHMLRRTILLAHLVTILSLFALLIPGVALADSPGNQTVIKSGSFEGKVASYDSKPENQIVKVVREYGPARTESLGKRSFKNSLGAESLGSCYTKRGAFDDTYTNGLGQWTKVTLNWQVTYCQDAQTGVYSITDEALMYTQEWSDVTHLPVVSVDALVVRDSSGAWQTRINPQPGVWQMNYGVVKTGNTTEATVELGYWYNGGSGESTQTVAAP